MSSLDDQDLDANRILPKVISPTDPCSAWTAKANKRVQLGYGLNYMIDTEHAVVVDVEATPARTYDEVAAIAISLGQAARLTRLGRMTISGAVKADRSSRDNGTYLIGHDQLRRQRVGSVTSRQQEFAGGFVDFLLGRGVRHPR